MSSIEATQSTSNFAVDELDRLLAEFELPTNEKRQELIEKLKEIIQSKTEPKFVVGDDSDSIRSIPDTPSLEKVETETTESETTILEEENAELLRLMIDGKLKPRELEKNVPHERAVELRRMFLEHETKSQLANLPYKNYDYQLVSGACCENPIGYMTIPVGCAGPLLITTTKNKTAELVYLPLATTEGALVASINRGCKVLTESGGVKTAVLKDAMSRAPILTFEEKEEAIRLYKWVENAENYAMLKERFESTSRFAKLLNIRARIVGNCVHLRFEASTGDAMGMNMISKASEAAMEFIRQEFPTGQSALSGNHCSDKKAAAINWIEGRGKIVNAWATIPADIVQRQLKTTVNKLVELCKNKNLIGSSTAGTIGGWNAQAANVVAALFLATGQDAAQVVSSSMCMTDMTRTANGDLKVTCDMNCLEVGTVGGGTILAAQQSMLDMLGCRGSNVAKPGANACRLAEIICAAVVAGEVSLLAALVTDDLVKSHMTMNRSKLDLHSASDSAIIRQYLTTNSSPSTIPKSTANLSTPTTRIQNKNPGLNVVEKLVRKMKHSDCFHLV